MDPMIALVERKYSKQEEIPEFRPGDNVQVHVKVREGNRERIQLFEGVVIARSHGGINESFTVRKISNGVGVERIFPLHCPTVEKIVVTRLGKVRRAKLYYLRALSGKAARIKERRIQLVRKDASGRPEIGRFFLRRPVDETLLGCYNSLRCTVTAPGWWNW